LIQQTVKTIRPNGLSSIFISLKIIQISPFSFNFEK